MISTTAEYALRASVYLGRRYGQAISRTDIAEGTSVPVDYLLKVLKVLDNAGIVRSKRGPGGGYALVKPPEQTTVLEVILAVDEVPRIKRCPLGFANHQSLCPLHQLLNDAAKKIEDSFRNVTIQDLLTAKRNPGSCNFPATKRT
jgi:Rrf2 family protein